MTPLNSAAPDLAAIAATLGDGAVARPESDAYADATQPRNTRPRQAPGAVLSPSDADQTAAAVAAATRAGARVAVQASGHGSGRDLGSETILIDTRGLNSVSVDAAGRRATVGAGAAWATVQDAAWREGLLGLSGTAPDVAVSGYTFAGGLGWLTRPHGMASAHLHEVQYVDAAGRLRVAAEDAAEEIDRDALWAFRGGAPVGIATSLTFALVEARDLAAGYLLWPASDAEAVISAWGAALGSLSATVTSTIAMLNLPPDGPFPDELKGTPVVHLSYASPAGETDLAPLREALRAVAEPGQDTTGPCDAERLATIHLDPPVAVPAAGVGRWLGDGAAELAPAILAAARAGDDDGLSMTELRHVATTAPAPDGAQTSPLGPFLLHGVGEAGDEDSARQTAAAHARLLEAASPVDVGRGDPSFYDGSPTAEDVYTDEEATRLRSIARALDPEGRFAFERTP